jgi:hypothetical protein
MRRGQVVLVCLLLLGVVSGCGAGASSSQSPGLAPSTNGLALADALVAKLQDEPFNAHVEQVSEMQIEHAVAGGPPEGSTIQLGGSIDISGDDLRMLSTTTVPGIGTWDSEIVVLGDDAWTRLYPGAALTRTTRGHVVAMIDGLVEEFRPIDDPGLLRYVGLETIDGQKLHSWPTPRPAQACMRGHRRAIGTSTTLRVTASTGPARPPDRREDSGAVVIHPADSVARTMISRGRVR